MPKKFSTTGLMSLEVICDILASSQIEAFMTTMRLLLVVDDNISEEELLNQLSQNHHTDPSSHGKKRHHFTANSRASLSLSRTKLLRKTNSVSHSFSSRFTCKTGVLRKIHGGSLKTCDSSSDSDDEDHESTSTEKKARKETNRKNICGRGEHEPGRRPKWKRRKSCEILKEKLKTKKLNTNFGEDNHTVEEVEYFREEYRSSVQTYLCSALAGNNNVDENAETAPSCRDEQASSVQNRKAQTLTLSSKSPGMKNVKMRKTLSKGMLKAGISNRISAAQRKPKRRNSSCSHLNSICDICGCEIDFNRCSNCMVSPTDGKVDNITSRLRKRTNSSSSYESQNDCNTCRDCYVSNASCRNHTNVQTQKQRKRTSDSCYTDSDRTTKCKRKLRMSQSPVCDCKRLKVKCKANSKSCGRVPCGNGILCDQSDSNRQKSQDRNTSCSTREDTEMSLCLPQIFDGYRNLEVADNEEETALSLAEQGISNEDTEVQQNLAQNFSFPDSMYVAVDCEMVGTGPKGKHSVLARCSIVDYAGKVLYDKYIRPSQTITDYRTPWSGIRPAHMRTAVPMEIALADIKIVLAHKIVIGHSVYHDFRVLGIKPDYHFVRDTAQCRTLVQMASLEGKGNSLKKLSDALLGRKIQVGRQGHCSVEDARATLDLFKLIRHTWEPELFQKWAKKDRDLEGKFENFINGATDAAEDFLHDKFWPNDLLD